MKNKWIVIGVLLLLYPIVNHIYSTISFNQRIDIYKEVIHQKDHKDEFEEAYLYNECIYNKDSCENYDEILNVDGKGMMGYIVIPKINVSIPIYHGTDASVLSKGIGHLEYTSLPIGQMNSHVGLSGHSGSSKASFFSSLHELEINDTFILNILDKEMYYRVIQISVVHPNDISHLEIIPNKDLVTLITCTPYGINTYRLLVLAERIE